MKFQTNNWKLTIRNLVKQKRATTLNVVGLAFGFATILFIGIYVHREFTYDNFHENVQQVFKPEFDIAEAKAQIDISSNLPLDLIDNLKNNVAGIQAMSFLNYSRWDWDNGAWIKYQGDKYNIKRLAFSDKHFDEIFSFQANAGDLSLSLDQPDKLVLTKDIADKIFKGENPIGKTVLLNDKAITIGCVLEKVPSNSSIHFGGLVSYKSAKYFFGDDIRDWSNIPFIRIGEDINAQDVGQAMATTMRNSFPQEDLERVDPVFQTNLIPLDELYFQTESAYDPIKHGSKTLTFVVLAIGIIVLFLAIINYNNLLLATTLKWEKDFGIQQVLGANKNIVRKQLFIKGLIISLLAFLGAIIIINIALPWLNQLINYPVLNSDFLKMQSLVISLGLLLFTIFFSGFIPALISNQSGALQKIKGYNFANKNQSPIWKSLVTFQLFISITLIIASLLITKQINYSLNKDIGINIKNVVIVPSGKLGDKQQAYINAISDHVQTINTARSTSYVSSFNIWGGKLDEPGKVEQDVLYNIIRVNETFLKTLDLELVAGRDFASSTDHRAMIVNEAMIKEYNITNPLQASIRGLPIIGVVKDFNINSLHYKIEPAVLWNTPERVGNSSISFNAETKADVQNYMSFLKTSWEDMDTGKPFEHEFLDDRLAGMYKKDITLAKSVISFSVLAIFIACLGIFGLLSYIMEVRIKEIGIRKVNGAKVLEILKLVNNDLIKWISIAFLIAGPIAYIIMNKWLENFAYKTSFSWWIFLSGGLITLCIALLTVSYQSYKAATRNPIEALRYE